MGPKDLYLILYNFACCGGWAIIWLTAVQTIVTAVLAATSSGGSDASATVAAAATVASALPEALKSVYGADLLADLLWYTQGAALLEIVHALFGLVRSPVAVTTMQVMSRIVALVALTYAPTAQDQWGAGLMILSWASVEVPRYLFYVFALLTGDATKKTPYPLFWLRYSLFYVLYPSGILGEWTVFRSAAHDTLFLAKFGPLASILYYHILFYVYVIGSPFMIMNMMGNRTSAFKKRYARPPPPPRGLCWPIDRKGERSSTDVNRSIVATAIGAIDATASQRAANCKSWRFGYVKHLQQMVKVQCTSPDAALQVAQTGLQKAYELFEFVAPDGSSVSFQTAMASPSGSEQFCTGFVQGTGTSKTTQLEVPYKGQILKGQALKDQIEQWVSYGTIEPSCGNAMIQVVDNPQWCQNVSNQYFVLLGAGSAMGPLLVLLALGANVIAIDLDRPPIWKRLIDLAKNSAGTLTFPLKVDPSTCTNDDELCAAAGCNLFTHTPMIRDWLLQLYPGKPLTVGSYAYLDGALHVQVSLAMDAICRDLSEKRPGTSLAYLCTPTDLHLIPKEAHDAAEDNYKEYSKKPYCMLLSLLSGGKLLRKNAKAPVSGKGGDFYYVNGISVAQGPNYALAKRLQHWRAITARSKGCVVSSNIAPSTSTVSVVHNRTFAWAYEGMPYFRPFEIFAPETSNAVMSAMLLFDLNDPNSAGNPQTPLANPNQLFSFGGFHGGLWRCAYEVDSIGEASVFLYFGRLARPYVLGGAALAAAVAAVAVVQGSS